MVFKSLNDIGTKYEIQFSKDYNKYEVFILKLFNCENSISYNNIIKIIDTTKELSDDGMIYNILGIYNRYVTKNYNDMEYNYKLAIKKGNIKVYNNIANYYFNITKNYKKMIRYYMIGVKHGDASSMKNLGYYYYVLKNYKKMERYYIMAIDNYSSAAMNDMAIYHFNITKKYTETEKYFNMAYAHGCYDSLYNMGYYHEYITNNYYKMIDYYCNYVIHIYKVNDKLMNTPYYLDIYCNLDVIYRDKLKKTRKMYELEGRIQSCKNRFLQINTNINDNNDILSNNQSNLQTCNICMDSCNELISWDCHISHIVCIKCYPNILRNGICHICRAVI
jgi:tetratricopeptide (TPR) repeat protein